MTPDLTSRTVLAWGDALGKPWEGGDIPVLQGHRKNAQGLRSGYFLPLELGVNSVHPGLTRVFRRRANGVQKVSIGSPHLRES